MTVWRSGTSCSTKPPLRTNPQWILLASLRRTLILSSSSSSLQIPTLSSTISICSQVGVHLMNLCRCMAHICPKSKFNNCARKIPSDAEETIAWSSASHEAALMIFCVLLLLIFKTFDNFPIQNVWQFYRRQGSIPQRNWFSLQSPLLSKIFQLPLDSFISSSLMSTSPHWMLSPSSRMLLQPLAASPSMLPFWKACCYLVDLSCKILLFFKLVSLIFSYLLHMKIG